MNEDLFFVNGINPIDGEYLLPPLPASELAKVALGESIDPEQLEILRDRYLRDSEPSFSAIEDVTDYEDLNQTGWGVIFAQQDQDKVPAIKEALSVLLNKRREDAGDLFRIYEGADGYRSAENAFKFAVRHGLDISQPVDPQKMPYYLLIVGSPEDIPYRFQYQLDVQFATGRIYFDTLEEFEQYATAVILAETGKVRLPKQAAFFGVKNPGDEATRLSSEFLINPLVKKLSDYQGWKLDSLLEEQATRANLEGLLHANTPPALLFSASHGLGLPSGHSHQPALQGALLCQDWPGKDAHKGPIPESFYFSGDALNSDARLTGSMAFMFACYGAGTPRLDDYPHQKQISPQPIAPQAFISRLPQRMLGRGALAVIGHVERAFQYSFKLKETDEQIQSYQSTLQRIMLGKPVGYALEYFNQRYAALSSNLNMELEEIKQHDKQVDSRELSSMWTANNDARSFVLLGDPSVRLPLQQDDEVQERPVLPAINFETAHTLPKTAGSSSSQVIAPAPQSPTATPSQPSFSTQAQGSQPVAPAPSFSMPVDGLAFALSAYSSEEGPSFGIMEDARDKIREVVENLNNALVNLAKKMQAVTNDATTLSITTGVVGNLDNLDTTQVDRRYHTRISATGDVEVYVPRQASDGDEALLALHKEMVAQALANRLETIKAISSTIASLFGAQK